MIYLRNGGVIEIHDASVTNRWGEHCLHAISTPDQGHPAQAMDYDDADSMTRDHDPLHALLADILGLGCSYSLHYATGHLPPEEAEMAVYEEAAVMALQAYLVQLGVTAVELARRNGYRVEES